MERKVRILVSVFVLLSGCVLAAAAFADGGGADVSVSGGAVSFPETPPAAGDNMPLPGGERDGAEPSGESAGVPVPEYGLPEDVLLTEDMPGDGSPPEDVPGDGLPEDGVLHVTVPRTLDFVIDPFEIDGKGQIYSEAGIIENRGDTDVLLTFSDITVIFENGADIESMDRPFDEYGYAGPMRKALYMLLGFGRQDVPPLVLTDETARMYPPDILLGAAGSGTDSCTLGLSGSVNCDIDAGWKNGDVKISLNYHMEVVFPPEAGEEAEASPGVAEPEVSQGEGTDNTEDEGGS
jgi:hypothetical protein